MYFKKTYDDSITVILKMLLHVCSESQENVIESNWRCD